MEVDLTHIWSLHELADATGRQVITVRQWLLRRLMELPEGERSFLARKLTGVTSGWIVNARHPLISAYIAAEKRQRVTSKQRTSTKDIQQ